ncbi:thiol reductant ABC exporter subunit CydC [Chungangia koreensis]|uniref:Thiol reductant ABC exporter subunit CydC n=1 Tax=Chungangia koreensis TaxID=752657 RepID=A0ABV8X1D4_9LACT
MKDIVKLILKEKRDVLLSILFGFLGGIAGVALFAGSGYMISTGALEPPIYIIIIMAAALKLFGIASALLRYGERYFSHRATFTILGNMRSSFFGKLEPLAPGIFRKYRSGDLLARIVGDIESLQNFFLRVFYPPIVLALVFLLTMFFTALLSVSAALILFAGLILTTVVIPAFFAWRQKKFDSQVRESRAALSTEVTEFFYGFRDLKIHGQLRNKEAELNETANSYMQEQEKRSIQDLWNSSVNQFVGLVIAWAVLAVGAYQVAAGELDGIYLAMLVLIALTIFENAVPMAVFPAHLNDSGRASSRLQEVVEDVPAEIGTSQLDAGIAVDIEVRNVSYSFPEEVRPALQNVSIRLPAGTKTSIVGPSGSGKSTLFQVLLKMLIPDEGKVLLNGDGNIKPESVWEEANIVLQENHFFYGTIRDNLAIAGDVTDEEMKEVLVKTGLEHLSLNQEVLEKGGNLSGGERQRLAISRGMLKGGRLWMLDEPTSSVDALTERTIYEHLLEQAKDDTLVVISHRLNGLERMDQIIVMENGAIIEFGSYEELMERKGYFYEMKKIEKSIFNIE